MIAPAEMAIARGAPQEVVLEVTFTMTLTGELRERFESECAARHCPPARLFAEIVEAVIADDLFGAVLDA